MIGNSWDKVVGESISQKVMSKVKPEAPLKNKIDFAQKKLQFQISKLGGINEKLQKKHDMIFEKIVNAQKNNKRGYAQAYAGELAQVRKMKNMVSGAKSILFFSGASGFTLFITFWDMLSPTTLSQELPIMP